MKHKHFLSLKDYSESELLELIKSAQHIKKFPNKYSTMLKGKVLLLMFAKPSLRTRISFEVGMMQLGGHSIYYDLGSSTLQKGESIHDMAKTSSRYIDLIAARLYAHEEILTLSKYADVPVINALTDFTHPCQILSDFLTILEKRKRLKKLKLTFLGDCHNNITHSLMYGCTKLGIDLTISCPNKKEYMPDPKVAKETKFKLIHDPKKAVIDSDIIYTDTWMSYQVPESEMKKRVKDFKPYQVNSSLMAISPRALFMHNLPEKLGYEVTEKVSYGSRSIIFDQASNRLFTQKAIMLKLMGKI